MTYLIERESYGRKETIVDVPRFAADLAVALGAKPEAPRSDIPDNDLRHLRVGDLSLSVYSNRYGSKGRVHISCTAADVTHGDRPYNDGRGTYGFPDAWVSPDRPMATIAKDIKRRVIDAAAEPLANTRRYVEKLHAQRDSLADAVAKLTAAVPEMRERSNGSGNDSPSSKTLDWSGRGVYLSARVYNDAQVGIDRIGNLPLAAFIEIAAVLRKYAKD